MIVSILKCGANLLIHFQTFLGYLTMLVLKLIHISKRGTWAPHSFHDHLFHVTIVQPILF